MRGKEVAIPRPPRRVVSLVPSITETLFDIGAGADVVGVTDWCIYPERIGATRLGGTKNPRVDEIRELQPDLVHMNLEENLERHARAIEEFAPVFVTEPKSPGDVAGLLRQLGAIHGVADAAERAAAELERELARPALPSFTFVVPIWRAPWMWCGGDTYVSALVESLGGTNALGDRSRYPSVELGEVAELAPDVILLPDEPYAFRGDDAIAIGGHIPARIIGPFPGHLATWHGTRTVKGLRYLRGALGVTPSFLSDTSGRGRR
ncbi:MAG: ABC transporter substrate-binding protein [Acidobacteria bacterium]|nr:ABC transporter substrate-binding protein [Acidobacteriota bacterium]